LHCPRLYPRPVCVGRPAGRCADVERAAAADHWPPAGGHRDPHREDFPELPEPYNNLAVLYASEGQLDSARAALEMALAAAPNYATALENLGDVYLQMAADAYQRAAKLDPSNRQAGAKLALSRELINKSRNVR